MLQDNLMPNDCAIIFRATGNFGDDMFGFLSQGHLHSPLVLHLLNKSSNAIKKIVITTPHKLPQIVFKIKILNKHDKLIPYGNKH